MHVTQRLLLVSTLMIAFQVSGQRPVAPRDGAHDFDFNIGTWHTHIRRLADPFSPSSPTIELDGTVTVRPLWGGKAEFEEIQADGPNGRWEGMNIFLYDPVSHEWSQTFANDRMGAPGTPSVGFSTNGRIEMYGQDTFKDKPILVRTIWSDITPNAHHYSESYSNDSGRTWHVSFSAELTRQNPAESKSAPPFPNVQSSTDPAHGFDWDVGSWKIQVARLTHPLTGSTAWTHMKGTAVDRPFWGGRGNIAEVKAQGAGADLELLALRLYNPSTHEWTISFATSGVGVLNPPCGHPDIGTFSNRQGDFIDQEPYNGHTVLVRFRIRPIDADHTESEQAFSADGGKTWETNWITRYTRLESH